MGRLFTALVGAAAGAAAVYLYDEKRGVRRRTDLMERARTGLREAARVMEGAGRDIGHRAQGLWAEIDRRLAPRGNVEPRRLAARVRSALGRVVSNPAAIDVTVGGDRVQLTGAILDFEHVPLLRRLRAVPGVGEIDDRLQVYHEAGHIPSLQGSRRREQYQGPEPRTLRNLAAMGGALLGVYSLGSRSMFDFTLNIAAAGLLLREAVELDQARRQGQKAPASASQATAQPTTAPAM